MCCFCCWVTPILHSPRIYLTSFAWWMSPGLACFWCSCSLATECKPNSKRKWRRPGNEARSNPHTMKWVLSLWHKPESLYELYWSLVHVGVGLHFIKEWISNYHWSDRSDRLKDCFSLTPHSNRSCSAVSLHGCSQFLEQAQRVELVLTDLVFMRGSGMRLHATVYTLSFPNGGLR